MSAMVRMALAGMLVVAGASLAQASPEGMWEIEMRDSRYSVELCGDGTQLCGTLVWLGNGADTPDNLPYLNTLLIDHAVASGPNEWRGDLHIYGQTAAGTITQVSDDQITLRGCAFLVVCKSYQLYRMAE